MSTIQANNCNNSLSLRLDPSKSVTATVRHLVSQSEAMHDRKLQETMLQHLIEAMLSLLLGTSHEQDSSNRVADFLIKDVAIHVTTAPSETLIHKCRHNLDHGLKPIIITTHRSFLLAEGLAYQAAIGELIDVFDAEQFLASKIHTMGKFGETGRGATVEQLIYQYNTIVSDSNLYITITK